MLSRDVQHIPQSDTGNIDVRQIERLGIDVAVRRQRVGKQLSEGIDVYVRRSKDGLIDVLPGPSVVIPIGGYCHLRVGELRQQ